MPKLYFSWLSSCVREVFVLKIEALGGRLVDRILDSFASRFEHIVIPEYGPEHKAEGFERLDEGAEQCGQEHAKLIQKNMVLTAILK